MKLFHSFLILFQKACKADIVKVFSLTAVSTLVRMLTGLISVKVVAIIVGPSGIALLGQLNSFSTIIMNIVSGGINNGVTKYVSEHKQNDNTVKYFISVAFRITLVGSLLCGIFMILFHQWLSQIVMLSSDYGYVFLIFGFTVGFYAFNNLLVSILNGYKEFKKYVAVSIVSTLFGLCFTLGLVYYIGLSGALISAVTFQSVMLFVTLWMLRKSKWLSVAFFKQKFDKNIGKKYFGFAVMTLVSTLLVPTSQLFLRGYVISHISATEAGWWEAMNRISGMYLMVITTSFGVYYLPRLSEIMDPVELRREIFRAYKVIMPILIVGFSIIYFARHLIIRILFTPDFLPMENLFIWQLLGDLFKIASWLLAFLMLAKAMTKTFIITEVLGGLFYLGSAFLFIKYFGIVGGIQAYFLNYVAYTLLMVWIFRKIIFIKQCEY